MNRPIRGRPVQHAWDDLIAAPTFKAGDLVYAPSYIDADGAHLRRLALTPGLIIAVNPYAAARLTAVVRRRGDPRPTRQKEELLRRSKGVVSYTVLWPHAKREFLSLDLKMWGE